MGFASPALQVSHAKASQGDLKSSQEHPRRAVTHPHPFPQGSALLDAPIQHKCGSGLCAWGCKMLHVSPDHTTWNNAAQTKNYSSLCVFHPHRAQCLSSDNSFALWTSNHPMSSLPDKGWGQKDVTMDGRTGKRRVFFPNHYYSFTKVRSAFGKWEGKEQKVVTAGRAGERNKAWGGTWPLENTS